jgi:hypothetical protein
MHTVLRSASVQVEPRITNNNVVAHITVGNKFEHTFDVKSRVSQFLQDTSGTAQLELAREQLQDRMNGGNYFFVEDKLVDYRDSKYDGFIHTDNNIDNLMSELGFQTKVKSQRRSGLRLNTVNSDIALVRETKPETFEIPGYVKGGKFDSSILFTWSPFTSNIRANFELVRQICTNGAIAKTSMINSQIPIINQWKEHLRIAEKQLQNSIQSLATNRIEQMINTRATVRELQMISGHAVERLKYTNHQNDKVRLKNICKVVDVVEHLSDYYAPNVFSNKNLSSQLPTHLSKFDAWNCITEMLTHTNAEDTSTSGSLQIMANGMLFPAQKAADERQYKTQPLLSAFNGVDTAFFGELN